MSSIGPKKYDMNIFKTLHSLSKRETSYVKKVSDCVNLYNEKEKIEEFAKNLFNNPDVKRTIKNQIFQGLSLFQEWISKNEDNHNTKVIEITSILTKILKKNTPNITEMDIDEGNKKTTIPTRKRPREQKRTSKSNDQRPQKRLQRKKPSSEFILPLKERNFFSIRLPSSCSGTTRTVAMTNELFKDFLGKLPQDNTFTINETSEPKEVSNSDQLKTFAFATLGPMNEKPFQDFDREMKEIAKKKNISNPLMVLDLPESLKMGTAWLYPVEEEGVSQWEEFNYYYPPEAMPKVFGIDGTHYKVVMP